MLFFTYDQQEVNHLKRRDADLGRAMDRIGPIRRPVNPDLFAALLHSVVAQQISAKAAETVWNRLVHLCGELTPCAILAASAATIQQCGLSFRKTAYLQNIAQAVHAGSLDLAVLPSLPDADIISRLSALHGVGVWTAEMLLIFSLQRKDVVSWGDLAIRRGMMALYGLDRLDRQDFDQYRQRYSPYGSVASLYLWRLAAEVPAKKSGPPASGSPEA